MIKINEFRIKYLPEIGKYSVHFVPKHEVQAHASSLRSAIQFVLMAELCTFDHSFRPY